MRVVKCEKIYLSQNETVTWANFDRILEGMYRGCENPNTISLICKVQELLNELWEEVEDEVEEVE